VRFSSDKRPIDKGWNTPEVYGKIGVDEARRHLDGGGLIGVIVPEGVVVADFDRPENLAWWEAHQGEFPGAAVQKTVHGLHVWFRAAGALPAASDVVGACGVHWTPRIAGKNAVIVAPSAGRTWIRPLPDDLGDLPELPEDLQPAVKLPTTTVVEKALGILARAKPGAAHNARTKAGMLLGGAGLSDDDPDVQRAVTLARALSDHPDKAEKDLLDAVAKGREKPIKEKKSAGPTADQAALAYVRTLLSTTTWWATAAYGVGGRDRAEFFQWIGEHWEQKTLQEIASVLNVTDESMDLKNKCLGYLSTLAQVQGPAECDQLGFRLALINGVLDFQDGKFRPARPEDRLRNTLGRRYLLPHERLEPGQNRFFTVLGAYAPRVQRIIYYSLVPRMVAPWPGGKIWYLVGPPGTGKSKLISLLSRLIEGATASIHADRLRKSQFQSRRLEGALVNLTAESRRSEIKDSEEWKEDADRLYFEVEIKGGDLYQARYITTTARACNLMPYLPGHGSEYWRRLGVLPILLRLKGRESGSDEIERLIRELTDHELDSVFSEAADVAVTCGPEGTYPMDLDEDETESLYWDLVDGLRLFMQSRLKWGGAGDQVLLADVVDRYRESDYCILDRDKNKRDERGTYTLFELVRTIGGTMGGRVGQAKVDHGDGPQCLHYLTWAAADKGRTSLIGDFGPSEGLSSLNSVREKKESEGKKNHE